MHLKPLEIMSSDDDDATDSAGATEVTGATPSVIIIPTHTHLDCCKIVNGVLDVTVSPASSAGPGGSSQWLWQLVNKYYTAEVLLTVLPPLPWRQDGLKYAGETGEALIIYWDNTNKDGLSVLDRVVEQLLGFQPEVCMLVCDRFTDNTAVSKYSSNIWCVEEGFELIELDYASTAAEEEEEDGDSELEDDFFESLGVERIRGALHANQWTKMTRHQTNGLASETVPTAADLSNMLLPTSNDPFVGCPLLGDDDEESDQEDEKHEEPCDFEDLFARFEDLRVTAASLPRDDRLNYAEKVALAFLKAMGGEEDSENQVPQDIVDDEVNSIIDDVQKSFDEMNVTGPPKKYKNETVKNNSKDLQASGVNDNAEDNEETEIPWQVLSEGETPELEIFEELVGLPVLSESEESHEKVSDEIENPDLNMKEKEENMQEKIVDKKQENIPCRTYAEIEREINSIELEKLTYRMEQKELIAQEIGEEPECSNKKTKYNSLM